MKNHWTKLCAVAGVMAACVAANAFLYDATILINRALNSPTLTIRYTGASATLAELRVNGVSLGTRVLNGGLTSGETNFTLDMNGLKIGDNQVEIRLFDKRGKVVGTERTTITADDGMQAPVFVSAPKMGGTVQGPVEIKVGFGRAMRNSYISFFIDNQFKSLTNIPPYSYVWDSQREANGWHELEAWVVDDNSNTLKTKKIRVFVNNPGGRTVRKTEDDIKPVENAVKPQAGATAGVKAADDTGARPVTPLAAIAAPKIEGRTSENPMTVQTAGAAGTKAVTPETSIASGAKNLTPTGQRFVQTAKAVATKPVQAPTTTTVATRLPVQAPTTSVMNSVKSGVGLLSVTKGARVPNIGAYSILMNSQYVEFDVQPRVENGVPLTPLRHLLEAADGKVSWEHLTKIMRAQAEGREIVVKIGDKMASINSLPVEMELAAFLERGRTIVPLSFIKDTLDVAIEFDAKTGHVLITAAKK